MINVALLGNPNVGKTTVFNLLTGSNQHVGNWPGVTIDKKEGILEKDIKIVDLPGIYAMDTFSNEEKISKKFLEEGNVDVIVNIVDGSNLSRNLYLTTQLMAYNKPIILVVNMIDVAESKGIKVDFDKLSKELNVTVLPVVAKKKQGTDQIALAIRKASKSPANYKENFGSELETYNKIEKILDKCYKSKLENKETISDKIDRIVLNPILAYPIFIGALFLLFRFTFNWVGGPLQEGLGTLIDIYIANPMDILLANSSEWFRSLILDGIIAGVGGTLPFFPLVFVLFFGMSFLEDCGYMSRSAFLMDNIMKKVGLSGKAFIPMIMGFGCSSPAIMATRTLESEKDRKITALIAPFMTCSARLPIYALFADIFFPNNETLITLSLYLLGIVVAILVACVLNKGASNKELEPFILELPEYKLPTINSLFKNAWSKSKGFLTRVVTVMFAMSVIIWALSSFNFNGFTSNLDDSFLAYAAKLITPIFAPLGFGDWKSSVSIITGLGAKEIVVNTLNILYGDATTVLPTVFNPVSAYGFLVFASLYTPCIAVLATMKKEYGSKMMWISFFYQFAVAWAAAFIVNLVGGLIFPSMHTSSAAEIIVGGSIIILSIIFMARKLSSKQISSGCSSCSGCSSSDSCSSKVKEEA